MHAQGNSEIFSSYSAIPSKWVANQRMLSGISPNHMHAWPWARNAHIANCHPSVINNNDSQIIMPVAFQLNGNPNMHDAYAGYRGIENQEHTCDRQIPNDRNPHAAAICPNLVYCSYC